MEWFVCNRKFVIPAQTEFPASGSHVGVVSLWCRGAKCCRQVNSHGVHIGGFADIGISRKAHFSTQKPHVHSKVGSSCSFPGQSVRNNRRRRSLLIQCTVDQSSHLTDAE